MLAEVKPGSGPPLASPQLAALLDDFREAVKAIRPEQERLHRLEWENFSLRGRCAELEAENRLQLQDLLELRMAALRREGLEEGKSASRTMCRRSTVKTSSAKGGARTLLADEHLQREEALKALQQKSLDAAEKQFLAVERSAAEERKRHEGAERELIARVRDLETRLESAFAAFFEGRKVLAKAQESAAAEIAEARAAVEFLHVRLVEAEQQGEVGFGPAAGSLPAPSKEPAADALAKQYRALQRQWTAIIGAEREKSRRLEQRALELSEEKRLRIAGLELELTRLREELQPQ